MSGELTSGRHDNNQMTLDKLPINWFDVLVLVLLLVGWQRGRKRGMSEESITMLKWLTVIFAAALAYQPMALWLTSVLPLSKLSAYILCYLLAAGAVAGVFMLIKRSIGSKMTGSDTFGRAEYYLGMPAGVVRFLCILIAGLALLNARQYRLDEVKAMQNYQMENYGSEFFPTLQAAQSQVFKQSFIGPHIKKYLSFLLIEPTQPEPAQIRRAERRLP
jgi:uncharacterized membrane protein required for colicin V production